jgi:hypothetical protein
MNKSRSVCAFDKNLLEIPCFFGSSVVFFEGAAETAGSSPRARGITNKQTIHLQHLLYFRLGPLSI